MRNWTITDGESPRVYLINEGRNAVGEIVFADTRRQEDARLIAAAPDLFAALSDMINAFGHYCEGDPADDEIDALNKALAAITKAEKGSQ